MTSPISEPFVPLLLESLKDELKSHGIVEEVIDDDVVGEALVSDTATLTREVDEDVVPLDLHIRADSS